MQPLVIDPCYLLILPSAPFSPSLKRELRQQSLGTEEVKGKKSIEKDLPCLTATPEHWNEAGCRLQGDSSFY